MHLSDLGLVSETKKSKVIQRWATSMELSSLTVIAMFNNAITLNPSAFGGANADLVYDLVGWGGDSSSIRRVAATALTTPETLRVSHQQSKSGDVEYDQHLIRIDKEMTDPVKGKVTFSSWMVIRIPRGTTVVTNQEILNQVGRLIAFERASGALDKILNNEP